MAELVGEKYAKKIEDLALALYTKVFGLFLEPIESLTRSNRPGTMQPSVG